MLSQAQVKTLEDTLAGRRLEDRKAFLASVTPNEAYSLMVNSVSTLGDVQALMNTAIDIVKEHMDVVDKDGDKFIELEDLQWALEACEETAADLQQLREFAE